MLAGVPAANNTLYHQTRFGVGDPIVCINKPAENGANTITLIVRDIEMNKARKLSHIDRVYCPADFSPPGGLSGDRETATAQAAAEFCRRQGIGAITVDPEVV